MKMPMSPIAQAFGRSPDGEFVKAMKAHHQDAVTMARRYLQSGDDPMLTAIASNIIKNQTMEIRKFDLWLKRNAK